ncbi:glycosyltransferase family 1 protein [Xylogone sp. PMI_703]|nr:glycosyltransferase family 1 protein [Xylogone sp. PMI_703]
MGSISDHWNGKQKPIVVAGAFPAHGHSNGLIQISAYLVTQGFKVYFIGGSDFEDAIKRSGIEYIKNDWNHLTPELVQGQFSAPDGVGRIVWHLKHFFLDSTPKVYDLTRKCLETIREQYPGRQVILLHESHFGGVLPYYYGTPLPKGYDKLPRVINFQTTVNIMTSVDVPPMGSGLPPPTSDEDRAKIKELIDAIVPYHKDLNDHANKIYKPLGATKDMTGWFWDTLMDMFDITLLPYSQGLDYPRSDLSPKIKFLGGLPLKPINPNFAHPPWWAEILSNAELPATSPNKKKVIFITQGTTDVIYTELLIPTIKSLSSRSDLIIVATLGSRGASLPKDIEVPANTKVIDYFPYDVILPYTDVFVTNAGFGGFMHGIMNGVPMVLAGAEADKAEVSMRAEWSGVGVNLRSRNPSVEAIGKSVEKVLNNPAYKKRALELKRENEALDALGTVERIIYDYTE